MLPDKWITKDENGKEIVDAVWLVCHSCGSQLFTLRSNLEEHGAYYGFYCPVCKAERGTLKSKVHRVK